MSAQEIPEYSEAIDRNVMSPVDSEATVAKPVDMPPSLKKLQEQIRQLERKLQAKDERIITSEEYARIVSNYVATCEYWTAPRGELIYISPSCETMTGYPPKDFLEDEKLLTNIIVDEDLAYVADELKRVLIENDLTARLEICFRIKRRDEKIRCIKQISQKVYGLDGVYLGRRVSNIDLTDFGVSPEACRNLQK